MLASVMFLALAISSPETISETATRLTADPQPDVFQPVPVERIADDLARDFVWIARGAALDLFSTSWALSRCPSCREANPLGIDAEARIALKVGMGFGTALTCYQFRRAGKPKMASIVRWLSFGSGVAFATNNAIHGIMRR